MNYSEFDFTGGSLNNNRQAQQGNCLIAEPFLEGDEFTRSVVLLCEHQDSRGSFGLVLNKPSELKVNDVVDSLNTQQTLFVGGPVEKNTLHFLHTIPEIENSIPLKDGVFWGGDYEQIKLLDIRGSISSANIRFFMGYSGWGQNQLKSEIQQNSWIITDTNLKQLFETNPEDLWAEILKEMGGKYRLFSNYPIDPRLN